MSSAYCLYRRVALLCAMSLIHWSQSAHHSVHRSTRKCGSCECQPIPGKTHIDELNSCTFEKDKKLLIIRDVDSANVEIRRMITDVSKHVGAFSLMIEDTKIQFINDINQGMIKNFKRLVVKENPNPCAWCGRSSWERFLWIKPGLLFREGVDY